MRHMLRCAVLLSLVVAASAFAQTLAVTPDAFTGTRIAEITAVAQPQISISNVSLPEGDSGTTDFVFNVTLSNPSEQTVTVDFATADAGLNAGGGGGPSTDADDYATTSGTLTFDPGETLQTITVAVSGDVLYESSEEFHVNLSDAVGATFLDNQATGTILNDDAFPTVSISDVTELEDSGAHHGVNAFAFEITLTGQSSRRVEVGLQTFAGTAEPDEDFDYESAQVFFEPGETGTKTFGIGVFADLVEEPDETFTVQIHAGTGAEVVDGTAVGTILNDDTAPVASIGNATVFEGNGPGQNQLEFTVTISHPSESEVSVSWSTADDTATSPDDYPPTSGVVVFEPSDFLPELTKTITVPVNGDLVYEGDETLFVNLTGATGATIGDGQGVGTIRDDEGQPLISISNVTKAEGSGGGTTAFVFDLTLTHTSEDPVTVNFTTQDDSASEPGDYAAASGTITFAPGDTAESITVQVAADNTFEPDETFMVVLSDPQGAATFDTEAVGTIENDDAQPQISISDVSLPEGDSATTDFVFDVTLSNPSEQTVTVDFATANSGAGANADDYATTSGTLTFDPGETLQTITVAVSGDVLFEDSDEFHVNLGNAVGATFLDNQATGTIQNDDAFPTVSISDVTKLEGSGGNNAFAFEITLTGQSSRTIDVGFQTYAGTAEPDEDFSFESATLRFEPGETGTKILGIAVFTDLVEEPDETFTVQITAGNAEVVDGTGVGTILNDDTEPAASIGNATVLEGNGAGQNQLQFEVTLSHASESEVSVSWSTADDTATSPDDYPPTSGVVVFEPDELMPELTKTITVPVNGDLVFEGDETLFVNLTGATGATIGDGEGVGTIRDDDGEPLISISNVTKAEGSGGGTTAFVFDVTLTHTSEDPVTVNFTTQDGSASEPGDYAEASGTVTFAPGDTAESITVQVVADDTFEPDETLTVVLSDPQGGATFDTEAVGTIENDDDVPAISIGDVSMLEGSVGTTPFVFQVTLSNASSTPVTVDFTTQNSGASAPSDFAAVSGTLTFDPGEVLQTITVDVVGDTVLEFGELFAVELSNPVGATIEDGTGAGSIENDDLVPAITITDVEGVEGDSGTTDFVFTVRLSGPNPLPTAVDFATADGTAGAPDDYLQSAGTVTFTPGQLEALITVPVVGELAFEDDETFFVNLSNPVAATIADSEGAGTILNDDAVPLISISDVTETEEGTFTFDVTLSALSVSPVTVNFATADGTATSPADYASQSGMLTFEPGELLQTITVVVVDDAAFEDDETFFVDLSGAAGATIADNQGLGTIENGDLGTADLTVTKTGPPSVDVGQPIEYVITVTNAGPQAATNVVVTDTIPSGTTFVSATPSQGTCSGTTTVTCTLGTLNDGASATIELVVTAPMVNGQITNTATADSDQGDPTAAAGTAPTFVVGAAAGAAGIPTLSEWAMLLMLMALAGVAATRLRG